MPLKIAFLSNGCLKEVLTKVESSAHGWFGSFSERSPSKFRGTSEFRANSGQIPSEFLGNSEQVFQTPLFLVILCNGSAWLAETRNALALGP